VKVDYTSQVDPVALAYSLELTRQPTKVEQQRLESLLESWFNDLADIDEPTPVHFISQLTLEEEGLTPVAEWWVDLGSAEWAAAENLISRLERFSENQPGLVRRLIVGWREGKSS
jgi:hypothetical protein